MGFAVMEHRPVLLPEALELLRVRPGGVYADCTIGMGGHAERILESLRGEGLLIGLDRDEDALAAARSRLAARFSEFELHHENYKNLPLLMERTGISKIDGCLVDLGVSSFQLDDAGRGFSFRLEGPLDMRMDRQGRTTAADLVNGLSATRLEEIFRLYGEEPEARRIAAFLVEARRRAPFRTTTQLARAVAEVKRRREKLNPATRVFQALRIEVNQELSGLEEFIEAVTLRLLSPGGRLVVLAFHSLEDRIVKQTLRKLAGRCVCFRPGEFCTCPRRAEVKILTPRPQRPGAEELERNPRARSARLRAAERLTPPRESRSKES